jgi:7,8-dihydro-6-hydroxymethylpterin-pyrophosphokinase
MHVYLGLCSNLGEREMNLVLARDLLMKHDVLVMGQSEVRETVPLGGLDQPDYLNQVVECQTELSPEDLLQVCKAVEIEMGRPVKPAQLGNVQFGAVQLEEEEKRWESRIIDIDILFYGDQVIEQPNLTIPHYGIADRRFELECLCDIAPDFVHPVLKKSMKNLLEEA